MRHMNAGRDARHEAIGRLRRALRLAGWNLVSTAAALALAALAGEVWLRSTLPFREAYSPTVFVPGVGLLLPPDTEIRWTNKLDFWTVSRTNRLGFLDREPPSPERAAESCHVAVIGDSFVEAKEVPIADKFHVRLEEMAARELSHLDVTTSAFGRGTTGQVNQLPLYDEYARRLRPRLLVLVFVDNDFMDNSAFLDVFSIRWRLDPEHLPFVYAERGADGKIELRPPDPWWASRLPQPRPAATWTSRVAERVTRRSWLADWLDAKMSVLASARSGRADPELIAWLEGLSSRPGYEMLLDGRRPAVRTRVNDEFEKEDPSPVFKESLEFTAFALDQFKERAQRDGASLIILASHVMKQRGDRLFSLLNALAGARDVPVIDQHDHILRKGGSYDEAHWAHDAHWNPAGHRWAAEALLEYLKRNQEVCERSAPDSRGVPSGP